MQNDTISRSALVAELECFKMSMGDPVIRVIIDRLIGIVKAQPGAEVAPPAPPGTRGQNVQYLQMCGSVCAPDALPSLR